MKWTKYADDQIRFVIAKPGAAMAVVLIFAFIAGENLTELLQDQHFRVSALIFAAIFVAFPIWWSYFVVQAVRELRGPQFHSSMINE